MSEAICGICKCICGPSQIVQGHAVRSQIIEELLKSNPEWTASSMICRSCIAKFRGTYVQRLLETEKGELSDLEQEVLRSLREHEVLATNVESEFDQDWTLGEKLADKIASFGGSWSFLIYFAIFLLLWILMNSFILLWRPVDPYPFIFLNLVLSCLAAIQAPIIMMSQNRQEAKNGLRSQHDYQVNLKSELEIRHLHEKIDHLLSHQWNRLVEIQEIQLEALAEIIKDK